MCRQFAGRLHRRRGSCYCRPTVKLVSPLPSRMRPQPSAGRDQVDHVTVKLGHRLVKHGEPGTPNPGELGKISIGYLATAGRRMAARNWRASRACVGMAGKARDHASQVTVVSCILFS
jgi:hypothetical protein